MRGLVYIFIALLGVAIAATTYLGLTFTPIEAALAGLIGLVFALAFLQNTLHRRDAERLERAIQDLSRLLSTDAKAGKNLSQRLNELVDLEPGPRLDALEADVSVLGTVVRQLAETMADIEEKNESESTGDDELDQMIASAALDKVDKPVEPVIPLEMLRQALGEDRIIHHIDPIITLPQRLTHGYDLVPRLMLEDGELAMAEDFMPVSGGDDLVAEIEALSLIDAITFARRALTAGDPMTIYTPISVSTLNNAREKDRMLALLDANRAVSKFISFKISEQQFAETQIEQSDLFEELANKGVGFSLCAARSLRLDYAELSELGVRSVRADTSRFIDQPASYTDFHTADIAAYIARFELDLIMTGVGTEQHVLTLLDDGIGFAQGPHLATPGPIRSEFVNSNKTAAKPRIAKR